MRKSLGVGHLGFRVPALCGVLSAVLLLVALLVGGCVPSSPEGPSLPPESTRGLPVSDRLAAEAPSIPSKLAGAVETVDGDGIVRGTTPEGINYTVRGRGTFGASGDKVSLCAIGDQLATSMSLPIADRYSGAAGDGLYDFVPFYREIAPVIQSHDLRYINQETVMAGSEPGYSGFPVFNSPDNMAATIAEIDFNLVNFATNHTYDMGLSGIERSHEVWGRYPKLLVAGSYLTPENRETVHMIERNGISFAFLAYTYGDNHYGFGTESMPNAYYSCQFDYGLMESDIVRAKKVADVVIVSMHWGDEYVSEPNAQQYEYARYLADLGIDLVIGTHAHIMQPVKYITGEGGNTIPVVFGLSDIVSGWTITDTILSGIFTCDFVRGANGAISVEDPTWYPTIEWSDGGDVFVRMLKDMDEATTNANTRTPDVADDYTYLRAKVNSVGMEIPVVM
ncbi:MAG: CapA family protein [Coriobacteriaceae bacterium]|nr:CapA family protein [Coriobacteriaceae bacterium]